MPPKINMPKLIVRNISGNIFAANTRKVLAKIHYREFFVAVHQLTHNLLQTKHISVIYLSVFVNYSQNSIIYKGFSQVTTYHTEHKLQIITTHTNRWVNEDTLSILSEIRPYDLFVNFIYKLLDFLHICHSIFSSLIP